MKKKGRLLLVPSALSEHNPKGFLPGVSLSEIHATRFFVAERAKTARAFLKAIEYPIPMADVGMKELNKHGKDNIDFLLEEAQNGHDVGLISEAGVPGVADPGGAIVRQAHHQGIEVVPLVGPSSILMALMSSGMNGQRFTFHGYLPRHESDLAAALKSMEADSVKNSTTHIFIETPYRNDKILTVALKTLRQNTDFSVAVNLTSQDQKITTMRVAEWRKSKKIIGKQPAVYLVFAGEIKT